MIKKKELIRGWTSTTDEFMADQLKKVFSVLKTPEDVALHNDMAEQIQIMIDDTDGFLKDVARLVKRGPRNFLTTLARLIKNYSLKGYENGKEKSKKN